MYYILNPNIALRSFWRVPFAYYVKHQETPRSLNRDEFEFLLQCDAQHELPEHELSKSLEERGFIRPCEKGEYALTDWQQYMICDNRVTPYMNLMITGKCNYNCLHCFNAADNAPLNAEWEMGELNRLLDEARDCGINAVLITGGEPMVHKHFMEIVEGIYERGMFIFELNTNGYYIDQPKLDRFKELGVSPLIKISFDGIGFHDWMRGRNGAEEDALRAIRLCHENGFRVMAQVNMNRKNESSILPTLRMLDEIGIKKTRVLYTTSVPRWEQNAADQTMTFEEYYDACLRIGQEYIKTARLMEVDFWQTVIIYPRWKSYGLTPVIMMEGQYKDTKVRCKGIRGMVAVSAKGEVYPCMQMSGWMEAKGISFGNVKEQGLRKILQESRLMTANCTTVADMGRENERCASCKYFPYCGGGCPALGILHRGYEGEKILGEDKAKCLFFKKGYYRKFADGMNGYKNLSWSEFLYNSD